VQGSRHAQRAAAVPMRRRPRLCYFAIVGQVNDLLKMKKYYRAKSSHSHIERKGISNRFGTAIGYDYGLKVKPRDTQQLLKWSKMGSLHGSLNYPRKGFIHEIFIKVVMKSPCDKNLHTRIRIDC
jgi:hypothetical protein